VTSPLTPASTVPDRRGKYDLVQRGDEGSRTEHNGQDGDQSHHLDNHLHCKRNAIQRGGTRFSGDVRYRRDIGQSYDPVANRWKETLPVGLGGNFLLGAVELTLASALDRKLHEFTGRD